MISPTNRKSISSRFEVAPVAKRERQSWIVTSSSKCSLISQELINAGSQRSQGRHNDHYVKQKNASCALWFVVDIVTCTNKARANAFFKVEDIHMTKQAIIKIVLDEAFHVPKKIASDMLESAYKSGTTRNCHSISFARLASSDRSPFSNVICA